MFKWLLLLVAIGVFVFWLKRGKNGHDVTDPEAKRLDQQRYYVTPPQKDDKPPDDNQGTSL